MINILATVKKKMPKKVFIALKTTRDLPKIMSNYLYDFNRYLKYSSSVADNEKVKLEAQITAKYHVIEKGLSMPEPRLGFGKDKVKLLLSLLERYIKNGYSVDATQIKAAVQVLKRYFEFNASLNDKSILSLKNKADMLLKGIDVEDASGGSMLIYKEDFLAKTQEDFKTFANSRYSARNFSSEPVNIELLVESVKIAQKTPSVCNRQSSKVYIVDDKEKIKKALSLQNGNRGFGHLIDKVLIVTSDLNAFKGLIERNQSFIDGGMFSMSLIYALHYQGLGACALNWSVSKEKDNELRDALGIKQNENIMMMIGIGHLPDQFSVPISKRKDLEEILTVI